MKMQGIVSCYSFCSKPILLLLFYILCFETFTNASSTFARNATDHQALIAFKSEISNDPYGVLKSWNDSLHFCQWRGVICSRRRDRVITLDLSSNYSLVGSLSPYVGNLSFLREIRLSNNKFRGAIPDEIGRLFRLQVLDLANNSFEGKLPPNLSYCSNLNILIIRYNKFAGMLPVELASMSKLTTLFIDYNLFTGAFPPFFGNLTSLSSLSAAGNDFRGSIPDSLGQLRSLRGLALGGNKLSGKLPLSIYNLSMLSTFSLPENQLEGNLPWDIGLTFPHLIVLQIRGNHFSGKIPVTLSNASELETIIMSTNSFSGKVTVSFGHLQQLVHLNLAHNHLGSGEPDEMDFFNSLANCSSLRKCFFDYNQLKGTWPKSIANLSTNLMVFFLAQNNLVGDLPLGLGNLVNLNALGLQNNQFTGMIPKDMGQLQKLQLLDLSVNKFSGEIPNSFGNLTLLNELYLDHNRLNGSIPSSLGNCQQFEILSLSQNYLTGSIPKELFSISDLSVALILSHNHLVGSLPSEVGKLRNLLELDVSKNKLFGEIPSSLSGCASLLNLYLDNNFFQGIIPTSLSFMRGIQSIDLSSNNLTGTIPEYMEKLSLEYLNLAFNNFEGEVPIKGIFSNASAVSVEGNKKLCGGIDELGLPKCNIKESKRGKLSPVLVIVICVMCTLSGVLILSIILFCWSKRKTKQQRSGLGTGFSLREPLRQLSYEALLKATDGFSSTNLIGKGSFGSVYKGILGEDGTDVAVKVLDLQNRGALKSFMAECEALRNIRHRNLVKVMTSCSSIDFHGNDFKALVYKLMPNGSLETWLHASSQETNSSQARVQSLNLLQRISIIIDVASALDYLHHHCWKPIVHCDLKPSNILLDSDMTALVGDFGLARFMSELRMPNESSSIAVRGTIGYTAPEYGMGSEVTVHGDVYSYGILVLEMMTGKRPTDSLFEGGLNLHNYARTALPDQVMEIADPKILHEAQAATINSQIRVQARYNSIMDCLISMIRIGVACSVESPQDRMGTSAVLTELHLIRKNLLRNQLNY